MAESKIRTLIVTGLVLAEWVAAGEPAAQK